MPFRKVAKNAVQKIMEKGALGVKIQVGGRLGGTDIARTEKFIDGESYEDVKARVQDFLHDVKKNFDGKHVAIVAHKAPQLALDVLLMGQSWQEAFEHDWRKTKSWQPGWEYTLE